MVPVNYLAVLVAAIASMVIGSLWYGPLFGKQWMAMSGIKSDPMKAKSQAMTMAYICQIIASLVMAFVLSHTLIFAMSYLHESGVSAGLMTGFWNWLGFIAPTTLAMVLWEGKPWKLWILTNAQYLITLCVMGVILAVWM